MEYESAIQLVNVEGLALVCTQCDYEHTYLSFEFYNQVTMLSELASDSGLGLCGSTNQLIK